MAVLTRILFCVAALAIHVQCLPLDREKQDEEINFFPDLGKVNSESPFPSLIEHILRQVETKLLRQFDTGFASTTGLGNPVIYPGIGTGLSGINSNLLPNPGFVTNTVVRPQSGSSGFGNAIIGSIIGSVIASVIPAILRPRVRLAAAALRDALNNPNVQQNFDAYFMNMPGSKDAYLYLTQAEDEIEDDESNSETSFDFPSIPYEGTKIGTVNIKAPPSSLEIGDSITGELKEDYKVYETRGKHKHDYKK